MCHGGVHDAERDRDAKSDTLLIPSQLMFMASAACSYAQRFVWKKICLWVFSVKFHFWQIPTFNPCGHKYLPGVAENPCASFDMKRIQFECQNPAHTFFFMGCTGIDYEYKAINILTGQQFSEGKIVDLCFQLILQMRSSYPCMWLGSQNILPEFSGTFDRRWEVENAQNIFRLQSRSFGTWWYFLCCILVEESGRFDSSQWSLNSFAEFTKRSPFHTVPVLEIDGVTLVDSVAILLVSLYPDLFYTYVI